MFCNWRWEPRKSMPGLHRERRRQWGSGPATNRQVAFLEILIEANPCRAIALGLGKHNGRNIKLTRAQASELINAMLAYR